MKRFLACCTLLFCVMLSAQAQSLDRYQLIPWPVHLEPAAGSFQINEETVVALSAPDDTELSAIARYWRDLVSVATGFTLAPSADTTNQNVVVFEVNPQLRMPSEGYQLLVTPDQVTLTSPSYAGLFRGVQTLRQLMPAAVERAGILPTSNFAWTIPSVSISDYPRFEYRGMHLDVARHFFSVSFIKRYLDFLAMYKMNRFHWHLTEDQGWRIEIKQYPKLTSIGGFRNETLIGHYRNQPHKFDGERYGGYYTQEEITEVVEYAAERYITVIPEIEMPGHSLAALSAYPELACTDGPFEPATLWGVFPDIYCPSETTFEFLENVLSEVVDLFPGEYIHIGGDEAPKTRWEESELAQSVIARENLADEHELQSYFIRRIEKFLNSKGKRIIGWDEILEGGLAPDATVMSWRGEQGGIEAAQQGHDVIMTPGHSLYFDHYQSDPINEPYAIGGLTTLRDVYDYDPVPAILTDEQASHVLGAQANVWTEYMKTPQKVEYMVFPRMLALSEVTWSSKADRNWDSFSRRLPAQFDRLDKLTVNYKRSE